MPLLIPWNDSRLHGFNILVSFLAFPLIKDLIRPHRFTVFYADYYMKSTNLTVFHTTKYRGSFGCHESVLGLVADLAPEERTTTTGGLVRNFLVMNTHSHSCLEVSHDAESYRNNIHQDTATTMRQLLNMPGMPKNDQDLPYPDLHISRWKSPEWNTYLHVHGDIKCLS